MSTNEDERKQKNKNKPLKNWAILSGIAIQMGVTIFLFAWLGKKLDQQYPSEKNWFTIGFVLIGVAVSIYVVIKQLNRLNS